MNSKGCEQIKLRICEELSGRHLSISHDRWHLERVLAFTRQLQAIHGGDLEVVTAAALLHDLGRTEPSVHGRESVEKSIEDAKQILDKLDLPPSKIAATLLAIEEHDQPALRPSTIEGRILKDADFLAGFGAWGVLRIAMWAAETQRGVSQVFHRLQERMPRRFAGLEFAESVSLAAGEMLFADVCLSRLKDPPHLERQARAGTYIVLEGISGSGKDTQADLLVPRLEEVGHKVVRVHEPTARFRKARDAWGSAAKDPVVQMFLLLADRYALVSGKLRPALERGDTVLSVRNFISTLVYQRQDVYDSAAIAFMHHFVPVPNLVVLYDVDADTALERCSGRAKWVLSDLGDHEQREALETHSELYKHVINEVPTLQAVVIDGSSSIDQIAAATWRVVEERIG